MAPKRCYSKYSSMQQLKENTESLCMWGLTSQKIPIMLRVLQLLTVKGICSIILGDIQ